MSILQRQRTPENRIELNEIDNLCKLDLFSKQKVFLIIIILHKVANNVLSHHNHFIRHNL